MSTFAGSYIKEPADLASVCTEADIIAACAPADVDTGDARLFAELGENQRAAIVAVANELVALDEDTVSSYARRQGYAVPLSPVDPIIRQIAARLLWISMRQRGKLLTADAAEEQRRSIRNGQLRDLAEGRLILTASRGTGPSAESNVYRMTDATTRDTDGTTPRVSRKTLEGF